MSIAREIARSVATLPVLPAQVGDLARLKDDPRAGGAEMERVVRLDASLTANLLRVANTAYFRGTTPCGTLRDAVVRLGFQQVTELALGDAFRSLMPDQLPGYNLSAGAFWRHCAAVAVISERIGRGAGAGESFFTAGLLHDMGKLVVGNFLADRHDAVDQLLGEAFTFVGAERRELGTDHAEVAVEVARRWNLPRPVLAAAAYHHAPSSAPEPDRQVAAAVHVADALAHALGLGADDGGLHRQVERSVLPLLKLDDRGLEALCRTSLGDVLRLGDALAVR